VDLPVAADIQPGDVFAGHRVEGIAGRGGMGVVYRAVQLDLDRLVALKLIAAELAQDEEFRERFVRESRAAASIDHPNVIPIYYTGEHDGLLYIAMRYVEGSDLRTVVRAEGRLAPARAARIVAQVGSALDAAHARGLVHRDVKPANVLVTGDDHCYLTDFGLVEDLGATTGATRSAEVLGTLDYVAPERIRGGATGPWTDVYALGCVLFFALTGRVVFPLEEPERKLWAHLSEPPPSASVAPAVDAVVARALAKDPRERYESAPALAAALQEAMAPRSEVSERVERLRAAVDPAEIERRLLEVRAQQLPGKVELVDRLAQELAARRRTAARLEELLAAGDLQALDALEAEL
jgi:serine/threonine protein kinase